ncbi:uncharacterized WD repeat-containing protein alr3466-like [Littorina saxatilis]|uniref:Uncharacterized protein n=1 Tax=Littorina saxatilis TaxID=31220 RepID=A0AAN9C8A8_9CAEN
MAMERQYMIRETHTRPLTAVGYNPTRREILVGCEDGVVKAFEAESGKLISVFYEHKGWVTDFMYWSDTKVLISSANDGDLIAWGSGGGVSDRIVIGMPVYCMAINPRRHQLVCGVNGGIRVYALDGERECGHLINNKVLYFAREHTDIVRCILCLDSRIYSAGYDQKLVIYDSSYTGDYSLDPIFNHVIHDAGITCLQLARDSENNTWIMSGSFDKCMKMWTVDGKLVHKLDNFFGTVTGLCYVPRNKTVWVAGGASYAWQYDPKSGDNVSDFIGTFQNIEEEKYHLQVLKYCPELSQVVATTSRRQLLVWKFNTSGCITALKCTTPIESLCYTSKIPILLFSGDHEGLISKWERMQSNHFMYSKEVFLGDLRKKKHVGTRIREQLEASTDSRRDGDNSKIRQAESHYAFNKQPIPPLSTHNHAHTTILKVIFIESLDYILAASEDSNVYVWGFDDTAVQVLQSMRSPDVDMLIQKYAILLDPKSQLLPQNSQGKDSDSVTNRVAGFVCKGVLSEHYSCVTSLITIGREHGQDTTYVLSGGWDRRICLWDIEALILKDVCRTIVSSPQSIELMCDGIITDMAYSPKNNEFAHSSSDKMVYIRKFNPHGSRQTLLNTLQGHETDVTAVEWSKPYNKWITGSEDGTVRIWNGTGMNDCEQVLTVNRGVTCLCIDQTIGSIVIAIQNNIRVYEPEQYRLVQSNLGHVDSVRSVIHVPERNQYVSCSWDNTIRAWNAWKIPRNKNAAKPEKKNMRGSILSQDLGGSRESDISGARSRESNLGGARRSSKLLSKGGEEEKKTGHGSTTALGKITAH